MGLISDILFGTDSSSSSRIKWVGLKMKLEPSIKSDFLTPKYIAIFGE